MPSALLPLSSLVSCYQLAPISHFLRCGRSFLSISLSCRGWVLEADHLPSLLFTVSIQLHPCRFSPPLPLLAISSVPPSPIGEYAAVPSGDAASLPSLSLFLFTVGPISPYPCLAPVPTSFISPFCLLASPSFAPPVTATMAIFSTGDLPCFLSPSVGSLLPP